MVLKTVIIWNFGWSKNKGEKFFSLFPVLLKVLGIFRSKMCVERWYVIEIEEKTQVRGNDIRPRIARHYGIARNPQDVAEIIDMHGQRKKPLGEQSVCMLFSMLSLFSLIF
jgi:hypothetical protein